MLSLKLSLVIETVYDLAYLVIFFTDFGGETVRRVCSYHYTLSITFMFQYTVNWSFRILSDDDRVAAYHEYG